MSRDVGVGQLVEELQQRGDRLPFEIGAFVALEACEGLLQESVRLEADDVRVTLEGSVLVSDSAKRTEPEEAARSLVSVLARLLVAAGPGVPPHLLRLVNEGAAGEHAADLRHLHDAIEASLIPINRGASRRVLARLVRESDRPPAPPQVDPDELDAELDELLRDPASRSLDAPQAMRPIGTTPDDDGPITEQIRIPRTVPSDSDPAAAPAPPVPDLTQPETVPVPPSEPARASASMPVPHLEPPPGGPHSASPARSLKQSAQPGLEPITATIRKWSRPEDAAQATEAASPEEDPKTESASAPPPVPTTPPTESASAPPPAAPEYDRPSLPQAPLPRRRGGFGAWLLAAALGLGAYVLISSGSLGRLLERQAPEVPPAPGGTIDVTVTPADAQIFVFIGRGPAIARDLPTVAAHEFVVFDRGLRPSRAIVPAAATWTRTENGPLYELAVQSQPVQSSSETLDFGSPKTAPAPAGAGALGAVRIVTNPPGAKVYRFVGVGPTVQMKASSVQEGQEVLVYHAGYETRREVVGPSDWKLDGDSFRADLEVELSKRPESPAEAVPED